MAKDTFGYLPTIDAPAKSTNTVLEIIANAKLIRDAVHVESVIIVFDQGQSMSRQQRFFEKIPFSTKTSSFE